MGNALVTLISLKQISLNTSICNFLGHNLIHTEDSVKWIAKKHASNFPSPNNCFHKLIGGALEIATILSVFPVSGTTSNRAADIKFKWMSIKTIYSLAIFSLTFAYMALSVYKMFNDDLNFDSMSNSAAIRLHFSKDDKTTFFFIFCFSNGNVLYGFSERIIFIFETSNKMA